MTHEVMVLCSCDNIEQCSLELYVSDVRIAVAELEDLRALRQTVERVWGTSMDVLRRTA